MGRKRTSRAARRDDCTGKIRSIIEQLQTVEDDEKGKDDDRLTSANDAVGGIDFSEIECLRDEITEWKDNLEEHFSATDKYARLEECAETLEEAVSQFESTSESLDSIDELEQRISDLEEACDTAESAEFPGMFG